MKRFGGLSLGFISLLLFYILSLFPDVAESLYGKMIYPIIRFLIDNSFALLPFSLVYLFFALLGILLIVQIIQLTRKKIKPGPFIITVLNFTGFTIFFFYFLWGFNYARPPIKDRMITKVDSQLSLNDLWNQTIENALQDRTEHTVSEEWPFYSQNKDELDSLPGIVQSILVSLNHPAVGEPSIKPIYPKGLLRKLGVTGMYFPFVGEGIIEPSLSGWDEIFVRAHELSHAYGIGDEGEANYIAFLACHNSRFAAWRYAAGLNLIDQLMPFYYSDSLKGEISWIQLPPEIRTDRRLRYENAQKYKALFPKLSQKVNDNFLQLQGINAGIESYDQFLQLVLEFGTR